MIARNQTRGGARPGAGRKADPLKDVRIGAATAQKLLKQLEAEKEIVKVYKECGDARLKVQILFRLREDAYGRPGQRRDDGDEEKQAPTVRVLIEHIGARASHSASAKAK